MGGLHRFRVISCACERTGPRGRAARTRRLRHSPPDRLPAGARAVRRWASTLLRSTLVERRRRQRRRDRRVGSHSHTATGASATDSRSASVRPCPLPKSARTRPSTGWFTRTHATAAASSSRASRRRRRSTTQFRKPVAGADGDRRARSRRCRRGCAQAPVGCLKSSCNADRLEHDSNIRSNPFFLRRCARR